MADSFSTEYSIPQHPFGQSYSIQSVLYNISSGHGLDKQQWNALIGIITAIVGNVLISFALNLQRYAHIRLNREQKSWQGNGNANLNENGQFATQIKAADKRSELNAKTPANGDAPDERTSLIGNGKNATQQRHDSATARSTQLDMDEESDTEDDEKAKKSYLKSPWWWAGIILMTIGEAGNFLAYGFAPASLVSPLGVVALISNCIIAPWLLKEKFRKRDGLGVLIAIGGVVTLVLSSTGQEKRMGPDDIWFEITKWEFELYLGLTGGAMIALIWASEKYGDRTLLIDLGLVGLFGGYTALSTKGIASLLSDTLWKAVTFPIFYLLAIILVGTALMQIRYLNRALSRFDSTQVIPTQFVMFTISVIVGSAVLYGDFESADAERVGKFVGGCALTFLGVYMITSGRKSNDGTKPDDSDSDIEEGINLIDEADNYQEETAREQQTSHSRQNSLRPMSKAETLDRLTSNTSQMSQQQPPSTPEANGPYGENTWANSSRDSPGRFHSNHTISSVITDTSETQSRTHGATPSKRKYLTATPEHAHRHRRSIANLMPGPISTPLSSSLSGVIADRRRELEASASKLRRGLSIRRSKSSRLRSTDSGGEGNGLFRNPPSAPVPTLESNSSLEAAVSENAHDRRSRSISFGGNLDPTGSLQSSSKRNDNDRSESSDALL